ncbi:MAG TPA: hypothetical protein P5296_10525 [Anaerohalosphaeraceae bacterium]|nr:hypothetical protein [Anaerohalosphaeraceae bacterium]
MERNMVTRSCVLALFLFTGCHQLKGLPDRHVKREVLNQEIVGIWQVTARSLNNLRKEGYGLYTKETDHELIFRNDGTCTVRTYTAFVAQPSNEEETALYVLDQIGAWKIVNANAIVGHSSRVVRALQIELRTEKDETISMRTIRLFIAEESGRLVLWTYIGDPDYVRYQDYVKSNS